jgi:DNA repair exonuclease SbcCD ATPase subunit
MNPQIQQLRNKLEQLKGSKIKLEKDIETLHQEIRINIRQLYRHEKAREIIKEVGIKTQQQLQYHISNIVSLALEAVFDDPYELSVEFVLRRNKTECDISFVRDGNKIDPLEDSGGGANDVASFALRVASWSMENPHSRNVIILDEPFKHLKGFDANIRVLDMIKEISQKLNLQIIMISDERISREDIEAHSDRIFEIKLKNGISKIV